ncbi:MAG: hypothetical protein JSS90_00095 [Bacteroidetes bacterium]|nr:hypothetical protein [Bacteroidota bacterium]
MKLNKKNIEFITTYNVVIKLVSKTDLKLSGRLNIRKKIPFVNAIAAKSKRKPERNTVEKSTAEWKFSNLKLAIIKISLNKK